MNDVKEKYEELSKLGSGHFGTVYKVRNKVLDRVEALKIINDVLPTDIEKHLEAKVQHKLKHNNVVEIYDAYVRNNKLYISMEYLDCGTLENKAKEEYLMVKDLVKHVIDCLYGLQHIHNNGYIHRDLKPNNILMSDNYIKLSDFGLTGAMDVEGELKSSYGYSSHRAPEVYIKNAYCEQSDIYALGVTAYRLLNGDAFIKKSSNLTKEILSGTFPPREKNNYRLDVPIKLIDIINKAMDIDIAVRYTNAHQFRQALKGISIPIDWVKFSDKEVKQSWIGTSGDSNYKLEVSKRLFQDKYNIEVFKGTKTLRKITKYCKYDIPGKSINNQIRKTLTSHF